MSVNGGSGALQPPRRRSPNPSPSRNAASPVPLDLAGLTDESEFESEAAWLNDLLSPPASLKPSQQASEPSLAALDTSLARTLAQLDVATHDTSALVDRTIDDISRSVPRLTFDLQLMRENALLLRFTLDGIRKRAGSGSGPGLGDDSPVSIVMEKLRVLDLVKARMEAARDVLREAESWSTLESEVTALVGEQAYSKAAERLEEAARSMVVFQNTTEYEARRALMVSLQNQLEASLSASLVVAINTRDVKACKTFYAIFGQIQREAEFTAYYFGSRRATLVSSWTNTPLEDCRVEGTLTSAPPPSAATRFAPYLVRFYSDLHALLNEEQTYVPAIFPDPSPTLSSFIQTTLEGLTPSLPQRLTALGDHHGPQVLPEIIQAYRATEDFALTVDRIMSKLNQSTAPSLSSHSTSAPLPPPSTPSKKDRRLSTRMSTSKRLGRSSLSFGGSGSGAALLNHLGATVPSSSSAAAEADEPLPPWEVAIFEPFLDWQVEYPELERQYLASELAKDLAGENLMAYLARGHGGEQGGNERALGDHTAVLFGLAEDAVGRALALTHGYAAAGLVDVLDGQMAGFFDKRRSELSQAKLSSSGAVSGGFHAGAKPRAGLGLDDDDEAALEGLEYSHDDWGAFQAGLRLLDTCRSISDKLGGFESKLRSRLTTLAQAVKDARNDPLRYTIPGTTRGAVTMLRQSSLNSSDLVALLSPLEKQDGPGAPTLVLAGGAGLLPRAKVSTTELTKSVQLFLHDIILAPLLGHLRDYASLPVWTTSEQQRPGGKGDFDLSIPTFSLSPSETISRVGEGLFNLPRLFEVYAANNGLAFSIETLPYVDIDSIYPPAPPPSASLVPSTPSRAGTHRMTSMTDSLDAGISGVPPLSPSLNRSMRTSQNNAMSQPFAAAASAPPPLPVLSAETVIATWLSSLTLSVLHHLSTSVLPSITRLTRHGAAQLASDLWYISNVAKALDVDSPEVLLAWRDAVEVDELGGSTTGGGNGEEGAATLVHDKAVMERVARLRGWKK